MSTGSRGSSAAAMVGSAAFLAPEMRTSPSRGIAPGSDEEAARFLLITPPLSLLARAPYSVLAAAAIGLLPAWARLPLRLPYAPILEGTAVRLAGTVLVGGIRWALSANPPETAASAPAPEAPAPLN